MSLRIPSYRLHKARNLAVVTLNGNDHYLGRYDSPESREEYHRLIAEWMIARRTKADPSSDSRTVAGLILAFWRLAQSHYRHTDGRPSEELGNLKVALRPLRQLDGATLARDFGPLGLRAVRDEMVRAGLARSSVNGRVNRIRRAFRWAASVEMIPVSVVQALGTVTGLQEGRTDARASYRNAIMRACDRAFPHPVIRKARGKRLADDLKAGLDAWRKAHRWQPNQLRHAAATAVRARFGLEATQVVLGHAKADVTQVYAERDLAKAREVMREIG